MATGSPNYAITPNNGTPAIVSIGDVSRTAPTSYQTIITAGSNGSRIERLTFTAANSTTASVLRLFLYDGSAAHLYNEVVVPQSAYQAAIPAWTETLQAYDTPGLMPLLLKAGWTLRATINDSQVVQQAIHNSIAQAQTTAGATYLAINGSNVIAGSPAAIVAATVGAAGVPFTIAGGAPYLFSTPAQVIVTYGASTVPAITLVGIDTTGAIVTETITGVASTVVFSANVYKVLLQAVPSATASNNLTIGYSPIADGAIFLNPSKVILGSGANLSTIGFTLVGSGPNGQVQTETIAAGPNNGFVTSANTYTTITSVKSSATVSSNVYVGTPAMLGGVSVSAIAADF